MLQESFGSGGESVNSKRSLTQIQKLLQLACARPNALTLCEYRDGLKECFKPESCSSMKVFGFRLAQVSPGCSTHEIWKCIMEAIVTELSSPDNLLTLAAAIPVLNVIPLPLVLEFFLSPEREPMKKLRSVLVHDDDDVRARAIETVSKVTLDVAISVAGNGLFLFPFESHEARKCCQQDIETLVNDCWKLILDTLFVDSQSEKAFAAIDSAFTAFAMLFARSSPVAAFFSNNRDPERALAPIDDITSVMYKQAFPRVQALVLIARKRHVKHQADAMLWIALLLYTMMERSGARCPSVSVPYMEIDAEEEETDAVGEQDDASHTSTRYVQVDELVTDLLESWAFPMVSRRVSLAQATTMCRAIFILLAHPLQTFTRMRWAAQLVNHLIAQCYCITKSHNSSNGTHAELQFDLATMLVKTFAWLSGVNSQSLFVRTTEALYLLDHQEDRQDLVQTLMDTLITQVVSNKNFQLLQDLCAMTFFRQPKGFSRLSPRTNGSEVFRALCHALFKTQTELSSPSRDDSVGHQISQLIALRMFRGLLLLKLSRSAATSPKAYRRSCEISENIVSYTGLLSSHFKHALAFPALALRESLDFFQHELLAILTQIASHNTRLQVLWLGVRLHEHFASHLPFDDLMRELHHEADRLFVASSNDDGDDMEGLTFDSGLFGCGSASEEKSRPRASDINTMDALMLLGDCTVLLARYQPQRLPQLLQMCKKMIDTLSTSGHSAAIKAQLYRVIEDIISLLSTSNATDVFLESDSLFSKELFNPLHLFLPRKHVFDKNGAFHRLKPSQDEEAFVEPMTLTGSADPVSVQIAQYHPVLGHEEIISLEISCCNLTTWPLNDLDIQLRPQEGGSGIQCVDVYKDLRLRLLRSGETSSVGTSGGSTSLPPFGVIKAEKRFRVCKFAQITFLVQIVLTHDTPQDGNELDGVLTVEGSSSPICLAFSDRYVLHFDTFLRLPQVQFATAAFFQHCWQSANSSVLWHVESQDSNESKLSLSQNLLNDMNAKVATIPELLLELPMHFHLSMLSQTRWGVYIVTSLAMSLETDDKWSGIIEIRSSEDNICAFKRSPTDTVRLFGGVHLQLLCSSPSTRSIFRQQVNMKLDAPSPVLPVVAQDQMPVPRPLTTSFHNDMSLVHEPKASFKSSQELEQVRTSETTTPQCGHVV